MDFCNFCNAKLIPLHTVNSEDANFKISTNSHICTIYICSNTNCEIEYLEELDSNFNLISFKKYE